MRLSDASGDGQAEADTVVIGAYAFGPALERLGERLNELGLSSAPVFLHWIHAAPRRARLALFADLLVITSLVVVLGGQVLAGSTTTTSSEDAQVSANASHESPHGDPPGSPTQNGELDVADGEIPENVTVFDDQYPAVATSTRTSAMR